MAFVLSSFIYQEKDGNDVFTVVLDAGHGGKDSGNLGAGKKYKEKNVALKIVLAMGKELEKHKDIRVLYTRKTDVFIDLYKRGEIANRANADLFVSVHCNAHHSQASGTETFVLGLHGNEQNLEISKKENEVIFLEENYELNYEGFDINTPESMIGLTLMQEEYLEQSISLASMIQDNFRDKLKRKDRSVKQAAFIVLHQTYMPSVLVETGFLTNSNEGKYLNSANGQQALSKAIANAILEYKETFDENVGDHVVIDSPEILPETPELVVEDVEFKIQISASKRDIEAKSYNFNGLSPISKEKYKNFYRYLFGSTSDYNEAKRLQEKAVANGYASCYIVAYREGEKIPIAQALKSSKKKMEKTGSNGR